MRIWCVFATAQVFCLPPLFHFLDIEITPNTALQLAAMFASLAAIKALLDLTLRTEGNLAREIHDEETLDLDGEVD